MRQCEECYRIDIFDNIKIYGKPKLSELSGKTICEDCHPIIKARILENRKKTELFTKDKTVSSSGSLTSKPSIDY